MYIGKYLPLERGRRVRTCGFDLHEKQILLFEAELIRSRPFDEPCGSLQRKPERAVRVVRAMDPENNCDEKNEYRVFLFHLWESYCQLHTRFFELNYHIIQYIRI